MSALVFHFSEDRTIERFIPHVPRTNPSQSAAVWAIDEEHAPSYWFPRACLRVTAWPRNPSGAGALRAAFHTTARRIHATELGGLDRIRAVELFRYTFDAADFEPWPEASGQWVSTSTVEPITVEPITVEPITVEPITVEPITVEPITVEPVTVEPVGDLLDAHAAAGNELRLVPSLWPLRDLVVAGPWDFSLVRMANASRRPVTLPAHGVSPRSTRHEEELTPSERGRVGDRAPPGGPGPSGR